MLSTVSYGTINSSAYNYLSGIVSNLPSEEHYFLYKSGDYTTTLIYGYDLEINSSNQLIGTDVKSIIYNSRDYISGNSYNTSIISQDLSSVMVQTDKFSICYSDLGHFAGIDNSNKLQISNILYTCIFILFIFIFIKHFRARRSYINL